MFLNFLLLQADRQERPAAAPHPAGVPPQLLERPDPLAGPQQAPGLRGAGARGGPGRVRGPRGLGGLQPERRGHGGPPEGGEWRLGCCWGMGAGFGVYVCAFTSACIYVYTRTHTHAHCMYVNTHKFKPSMHTNDKYP